ncbi:MAG: hypothetical protein HXY46_00930 [Syntrophaceae bacterium]|nr:hypothetical protein [Syntrophaceae bacterium]
MIRIPTAILEGKRIPRAIFSLRAPAPSDHQEIFSRMRKCYEIGIGCFDLPSLKHLDAFRELRHLTDDENLIGIFHIEAEKGVSFLGRPLHQFEPKIFSTIKKNLLLPAGIRDLYRVPPSSEVLTQKEIDRIAFDPLRLDKSLALLNPEETPFLLVGEKYGDWLLALARIDLLKEIVRRIREKGFIPIFSGQWATFVLPKAKPLDVAAYAVPINKKWGFFDLARASDLIKKFDRPVISLNPLADGKLLTNAEKAFSFLFEELKIQAAIPEISTEKEARRILNALKGFPSLISHRKA